MKNFKLLLLTFLVLFTSFSAFAREAIVCVDNTSNKNIDSNINYTISAPANVRNLPIWAHEPGRKVCGNIPRQNNPNVPLRISVVISTHMGGPESKLQVEPPIICVRPQDPNLGVNEKETINIVVTNANNGTNSLAFGSQSLCQ